MVPSSKTFNAPDKDLFFIGANAHTAAACERQHLALPRDQVRTLSHAVSANIPDAEFCLLSTCNRTEFYLVGPNSDRTAAELAEVINDQCPHFARFHDSGKLSFKRGLAAYEHLLRVSCGLESLILGETQIVQQVRQALQMARESRSTGPYLERAFGRALALAGRVRTETDISAGSPGVPAAICETIAAWQGRVDIRAPRVLLIGAGAINAAVARLLPRRVAGDLLVINRSEERARNLAAQFGGQSLPWSELPTALARAEVVVSAVCSPEPVVTSAMLDAATGGVGATRCKLVIDAGMPPNVRLGSHSGITIVGIDRLSEKQDQQLSRRRAAIAQVESRIEAELALWSDWLAQRPLENVLKSLYLQLETLPHQLTQHLQDDASAVSHQTRYVIHRHLKQLLHPHVMDLRRIVRARASSNV